MKAFPVIISIVALSFCNVDALPPNNYTVLEGSKVVLRCDYEGADPNQLLWVRGKLGTMSLDGSDFFTIARTLDPDLHRAYKIESDGRSSSLIMEDAAISDPQRQHPGLYKCVIDLYREVKYHVSIVKNDLTCRLVGDAEGTTDANTYAVGSLMEIECTITKDREPSGRLEFSLSVGKEVVQTVFFYGETLWKKQTDVATIRFQLSLKETYHGQSVQVALALNTFNPEVGKSQLKLVVAERLQLSYNIRLQCFLFHFHLESDTVDVSSGKVAVLVDADIQCLPNPRPYCLIFSAAPFESERTVSWQLRAKLDDMFLRLDGKLDGLSLLDDDVLVVPHDFTNETVYRMNVTKSLAYALILGDSILDVR